MFRALFVPAASLAAAITVAAAEDRSITPQVSWWGPDSAVREPAHLRIATPDEWAKLWSRHSGRPLAKTVHGRPRLDGPAPAAVPEIDFERCMVLAVFGGTSSNSDGIEAVSITENDKRILFRFDHRSYQTMSMNDGNDGGAVKATPYGVFVVPRSNKAVVLEENVQGLIGGPPIWKERARLEAL